MVAGLDRTFQHRDIVVIAKQNSEFSEAFCAHSQEGKRCWPKRQTPPDTGAGRCTTVGPPAHSSHLSLLVLSQAAFRRRWYRPADAKSNTMLLGSGTASLIIL